MWHLEDSAAGTGTQNLYTDATFTNANGDDSVLSPQSSGIAGYSAAFSTTDVIPVRTQVLDFTKDFSVNIWINLKAAGGTVFSQSATGNAKDTGDIQFSFADSASPALPGLRPVFGSVGSGSVRAERDIGILQWHFYSLRWQRATNLFSIFIDGGYCGTTGTYTPLATSNKQQQFRIGAGAGLSANALLDELSVSRVARTDTWIMLAFENQRPNQHLVTVVQER